jgi:hypothetical protein
MRMKNALKVKKNENGVPYLFELNATFFHFIFMQIMSIIFALIYSDNTIHSLLYIIYGGSVPSWFYWLSHAGSFMGFFVFLYSVILIFAAALVVYRLANIVDKGMLP